MDVTRSRRRARAELETAFEEIKKLKDQLHDENVALREQIDQAFMFEEIVGSSPALQAVLSNILKVASHRFHCADHGGNRYWQRADRACHSQAFAAFRPRLYRRELRFHPFFADRLRIVWP